ncbi:hypothetical protein ABT010_35375 [Streptomyces sp. NPDC002668]|uniref:hypothetical protein n=1 Tax=Streptomyces sp. NPDC002668 TaxID=3154422 RepID=UPI00332D3D8A
MISSPTEDVTDEVILPCTTGYPRIAHALLTLLKPGDLLRVSGVLTLPDGAEGLVRPAVDTLEVLATLVVLGDMVLGRYGPSSRCSTPTPSPSSPRTALGSAWPRAPTS